jgi:hypothetical protein
MLPGFFSAVLVKLLSLIAIFLIFLVLFHPDRFVFLAGFGRADSRARQARHGLVKGAGGARGKRRAGRRAAARATRHRTPVRAARRGGPWRACSAAT